MERIITSLSIWAKRTAGKGMFALLFFAFFSATTFSQNIDFKQVFGDLSSVSWKAAPDLNAAIGQERTKMDVMLAAPDLPLTDRSIFLCYQRLLDYVQADVQGGAAVDEAMGSNYEKVLNEAPQDPDLKHLPDYGLSSLIPGLVEALTEFQVPVPGQ